VDGEALRDAVERHRVLETPGARDMSSYLAKILADQPFQQVLGPVKDGSGASGVCVHQGQLIAEWGDPAAVEASFSVTKGYLSLVAGIAFDQGLLGDVHLPVARTVDHPAFSGPRHSTITWVHLLQQTSEWAGTLWDVPWWADPQGGQDRDQALSVPGSVWAYNDVRVNLLALALLHVFRRSLPQVLASEVMDPISASDTWQWHGYRNAHAIVDGRLLPSVSGGAHWGGGLWASADDHARVGLLYLRRGRWQTRRILSEAWVDQTWRPCPVKGDYGYLWWRNDQGTVFPSAPRTGRCARGNAGRQLIWVDPARDLVVVSRWTEEADRFLAEVSAAIQPQDPLGEPSSP
jgi:CubicO group peptidase (beta-lactamase class C family)